MDGASLRKQAWLYSRKGYGLLQRLLSNEGDFGGSGVAGEVVAGAVSAANDFNPPLEKAKK